MKLKWSKARGTARMMAGAGIGLLLAGAAVAQLVVGAPAPDFKTMGAIGGQTFRLHLAEELRKGPVVLYFFPRAFTKGCTLESKAFADAMDRFDAAGARVIGLSTDSIDRLGRFSKEACGSKVPMAHASDALLKAYDVELAGVSALVPTADRTSYVIGQDGVVTLVHSDLDHKDHVKRTLDAVERLASRD